MQHLCRKVQLHVRRIAMIEQIFGVLPRVILFAVFSWLVWWIFLRNRSDENDPSTSSRSKLWLPSALRKLDAVSIGREKRKVWRERLLFLVFLLIGVLAVCFDPFPKAR